MDEVIAAVNCPDCGKLIGAYAEPADPSEHTRGSLRVSALAIAHRMECGTEASRKAAEDFMRRSVMADMIARN